MANIASVLKAEIARVARKEVRAELESLKRSSVQYRGAIAQLRRHVAELQSQLKQSKRQGAASLAEQQDLDVSKARRFSPARLAAHRAKLGLSAAAYGKLVGMSGATIYLWEQGKSRPNAEQLKRLAAARVLSRRAAAERLGE